MKNVVEVRVKLVPKESTQRRHLAPVVVERGGRLYTKPGKIANNHKAPGTEDKYPFAEDENKPGFYKTGLDELIPNEFEGGDPSEIRRRFNLSESWKEYLEELVKAEDITRQMYYEILDGVDQGTYHSRVTNNFFTNPSGLFSVGKAEFEKKSYIEKFKVVLYPEKINVFTSATSRGRFAIQLLENKTAICKDKSYNEAIHNWYITEKNEEAETRVKDAKLENKALYKLTEIDEKAGAYLLYKIGVQLKSNNSTLVQGDVSDTAVYDKIDNYIREKDARKHKKIKSFLRIVEEANSTPDVFHLNYLIAQAFVTNTIYINNGSLYWRTQMENPIWYKFDSLTAFTAKMRIEQEKYNPMDKEQTNYFGVLTSDIKSKNIRVD